MAENSQGIWSLVYLIIVACDAWDYKGASHPNKTQYNTLDIMMLSLDSTRI
ncbi:MAG: hypothetical protein FWE63_08655 [Bacteroidales bacterium]|nr:hypothetical protein [Bacteroidales bacterium]